MSRKRRALAALVRQNSTKKETRREPAKNAPRTLLEPVTNPPPSEAPAVACHGAPAILRMPCTLIVIARLLRPPVCTSRRTCWSPARRPPLLRPLAASSSCVSSSRLAIMMSYLPWMTGLPAGTIAVFCIKQGAWVRQRIDCRRGQRSPRTAPPRPAPPSAPSSAPASAPPSALPPPRPAPPSSSLHLVCCVCGCGQNA